MVLLTRIDQLMQAALVGPDDAMIYDSRDNREVEL